MLESALAVAASLEPRVLTGPAEIVAGVLLASIALRLWWVHPVNRVFRLGPFVTEAGMTALLRHRATIFSFGAALVAGGVSRATFWFVSRDPYDPVVKLCGSLEAAFSIWAACWAVVVWVRLWRLG